MKIVADDRVAALEETFGRHGELVKIEGSAIRRDHLADADALITRTITRVGTDLLDGTPVRFVGTATIGFDHLDVPYLERQGITWTSAPGCNADATAQYTLAIFLLACKRVGIEPQALRCGIVGRGNVGSRLQALLERIGVESIACDPPLQAAGESGLCSLEEILAYDVISLHVPLTRSGRWPTYRMINDDFLTRLGPDALLVNTSRGNVIDGTALGRWIASGGRAALDVWPGEPDIEGGILGGAVVATPHIAGYSLDGKFRASAMVYEAFCACFGLAPEQPTRPEGEGKSGVDLGGEDFMELVLNHCNVELDDQSMRQLLNVPRELRAHAFHDLRWGYPLRRDIIL